MGILTPKKIVLILQRFCSSQVRVRFAPSPTGELHLGGLRTALYNYLFSRSHNGKFILRIEDTDQMRVVPNAAQNLEKMLDWIGVSPDESPMKGGPYGPYVQSQRLEMYTNAAENLIKMGHAYKCFCTEKRLELMRKEATRSRTVFKYDGRCRSLSQNDIDKNLDQGKPFTIRFKLEQDSFTFHDEIYGDIKSGCFENEGDVIIMKSDGFPTYHLANVVDDHYMEITHVLRGQEWQISTPKHLLLYKAFGWTPPAYAHLPLIMNSDGTKLSKRQSDIHVEYYKQEGYYPEAIINFLTITGGAFKARDNASGVYSLKNLASAFDLSSLRTNSSQVNFDRLADLNKKVLEMKLSNPNEQEDLLRFTKAFLKDHFKDEQVVSSDEILLKQIRWAKDRITTLKDLTSSSMSFLFASPSTIPKDFPLSIEIISGILATLEQIDETEFTSPLTSNALRSFSKATKCKFAVLMKSMRLLLSGLDDGPPVGEMLELLGKDQSLQRIQAGREMLKS